MRRILLSLMAIVLLITSYSDEADARRRRRSRKKRAPIINEKKLYERIGGAKGVSDIVDEWMRRSLADQKVAPFFQQTTSNPERLAKFRRSLNEQLCELADGPCQYKGPEVKKLQSELATNEESYLLFTDHLFQSMQKQNLPEREKNEMLGRVGELRSDKEDSPES